MRPCHGVPHAEEATTSGIDWEAFQEHQRAAARLSNADEARLLLDTGRHAHTPHHQAIPQPPLHGRGVGGGGG